MFDLLSLMGQRPPTPLDIVYIPNHMIEDFYTRFDDLRQDEPQGTQRYWDFLEWLISQCPALKNKCIDVNISTSLRPCIHVTGELKTPTVGRKYAEVWRVPDEHLYKVLELYDIQRYSSSHLNRYKFWKYLATLHEPISQGEWQIELRAGDGLWLLCLHSDDNDD